MRLEGVQETREGKKYYGKGSKRQVMKKGSLQKRDLRKMIFWAHEGAICGSRCDMLQPGRDKLLVMGHRVGKKLFMTFVHKWSKSSRRAVKKMETNKCPGEQIIDRVLAYMRDVLAIVP